MKPEHFLPPFIALHAPLPMKCSQHKKFVKTEQESANEKVKKQKQKQKHNKIKNALALTIIEWALL